MPEDRPDCPFVLDDSAAQAQAAAPAQEQAQTPCVPERTTLAPVVQPAPVSAALPQEDCVPCLGAAPAVYGALLQQFIDHELADFRTYQMLAAGRSARAERFWLPSPPMNAGTQNACPPRIF